MSQREYDKLFSEAKVDGDGVVRWMSNGAVPPEDILESWASLGLPFDIVQSKAARKRDLAFILADYRKAQKGRKPSAEEMFEMRANFEPGTVVVDVITGRRTRL
jgi:hypothetical protein